MTNVSNESVENGASSKGSNVFAALTIVICIVIGILIWKFVMGHPSNFENNDPEGHPLPGNYLGMVYKGGFIVPLLMGLLLMALVFSIERFIGRLRGNVSYY